MREAHFEVFFGNISGIYRAIQKLRADFAEEEGVKSVHIFWIYLLHEHPEGLIASELAEMSRTARSLVSREISELVERNMVCARPQSERRRYAWKFFLTEDGTALAKRIDEAAMRIQRDISREIPAEDLTVFYRVLSELSGKFLGITEAKE